MSDWWQADATAPAPTAPAGDAWWHSDAEPVTATGLAKAAGTGLVKGVDALVSLPGEAKDLVGKGVRKLGDMVGLPTPDPNAPQPPDLFPRSGVVTKPVSEAVGGLHEPGNRPERYTEAVAEFVPATLAGPVRTGAGALRTGADVVRRMAPQAILPGVASEAAGEATKGTQYEPYAKGLAALAGGVAGGIISTPQTLERALSRQIPEYVTGQHVARAGRVIEAAANRGVDLTWPEALSQVTGRPVLTDMQRLLESAGRTRATMQDTLAARPEQFEQAATHELGNIAPPTPTPSNIGPAVGQAAEGTVNDVRGAINNFTDPMYARAAPTLISPQDMAVVQSHPGWAEARDAIRNDPQLNRYVANLPDNSVGFLNEVKKHLDQAAENASAPVNAQRNMQRSAGYGKDAQGIRQIAENASVDYSTALAVQAHARETYLQPLLDGPLGKIAARDTTTRQAINALFPPNPLAHSADEITTAVSALSRRDPTAAAQLVRAHIESAFNEATQRLASGPNQFGAAKFASVLAGNPQQLENLRAAITALPTGGARWRSFEEFLDIARATGNRQQIGSKTAFNDQELHRMEKGGPITEAAKLAGSPSKWFSAVNDKVSSWQYGRNLDNLARVITDPNSGPLFQKIVESPRGSRAQGIYMARVIAQSDVAADRSVGPSTQKRGGP